MKNLNTIILAITLLVISVIILRANLSVPKQPETQINEWEGIEVGSVAGIAKDKSYGIRR